MKKSTTPSPVKYLTRSTCALANGLDVIGDKWTLLIVRDILLFGARRFGEFLEAAEDLQTNILADRLKKLEAYGIIEKKPYQENPIRYEYNLTSKGHDLVPITRAIAKWAIKHVPGVPPILY